MISTKKLFILFFSSFLCATTSSWCKDGLQIKGKLRILKPTTLQVNDLNGTLILSCELQPNKEFATEQKLISTHCESEKRKKKYISRTMK